MAGGGVRALGDLPEQVRALLARERRGVLTTLDPDGSGHSVPVVFVVIGDEIVSPIDHKPKSGRKLQRLSNIERDDRVTLLVDHWDEDWTRLAWVMVRAHAAVDAGAPHDLTTALHARYPQYAPDEQPDTWIRMRPAKLTWWTWE
ncbi:MAG TPA: pyridoxamine 5'-phosphate oxidase family protein [Actinomycetota bacterium]|nr:pyridoxamine 5'-phosphate oxidase family protein [Actinomycetota bacterium]